MNPELIATLAVLLGITNEEVAELSLEEIDQRLIAAAEECAADLAVEGAMERLSAIHAQATAVRELAATVAASEAEREAEAARILLELRGEPVAETPEPVVEEPVAQPGDPVDPPAEPEVVPEVEAAPEAIAASAEPELPRAAPQPVARLRPRVHDPLPNEPDPGYALVASAGDPDGPRNGRYANMDEAGMGMLRRWERLSPSDVDEQVPVVQMSWLDRYPEERILEGMNVGGDMAKINKVRSALLRGEAYEPALVASGGYCAPVTPRYDVMTVATAARPVRDALVGFATPRGGVTFIPPPILSDALTAVNQQTLAADVANTIKTCLTVTCGSATTVQTYAMVRCLQFGNFNARTFPENVSAYQELTMAAWARKAERALLTRIGALSTAVSTGQILGAARDILADVERAAQEIRNRQRMAPDAPLHVIFPAFLRGLMRTDVIRQLPGDDEFATTNAEVESWFRNINVNVTWALEGEAAGGTTVAQDYGSQAAGAMLPFIEKIVWYIYPEGSFLFLDGGVLDLGVVRDSTLNLRNNFQTFAESFEEVAFVGPEALRVNSQLCVNGATAATVSTAALCTTGS